MAMNQNQLETRTLLASHRILHINDQYEAIKKVQKELNDVYQQFNLMRVKCLSDMNQLIQLSSDAAEAAKESARVSCPKP